jgi:uncharacterized lipoprotein YmbA
MTHRRSPVALPVTLVAAAAVVGCSLLSPIPDATRFHVLAPTATGAVGRLPADVAVVVGPVDVPTYLQRTRIATRVSPTQIDYGPARWAEPLDTSVARVLATDLSVLLGTPEVYTYPTVPVRDVVLRVTVQIDRLDRGANGP